MITAQLADGTVLEFPDDTPDEVIDRAVKSMAAPQQAAPVKESPSMLRSLAQGAGNLAAGAVRGAGSIGATLVAPYDIAKDALAGKGLSLESNRQRRADMDSALGNMGAETDSWMYQGGKLAGEIAGTAGAGGATANVLTKVAPRAAAASPALIEAMRTGGMSANGATGAAGVATRAAGGALSGGLTAGMVNPEDAGMGAVIGGVMPGVVQLAGKAGQAINEKSSAKLAEQLREFNRSAPKNETVRQSIEAGYKIPPNMVKPSLTNQVIESISGKQATQQVASEANEKVTGKLVREALGIADDAPITQSTLENLRKTAGKAYAEVSNLSPQAAADLEALKLARNEASGWFKAYNRSASPLDLAKAKEARVLSDTLEQALEGHALTAGREELIPALRDARKQIAKTYTVGRAVNDASGTVDARVLGRMYEKGLPLSDGLDTAGRFASAFPTVAKSTQQQGSTATHNLKSMASLLTGAGGLAAMGPAGLAGAAIPFVAPSAARSMMFREGAQKALVQEAPKASRQAMLAELLQNPELQQLLLRSAPVAAAQ